MWTETLKRFLAASCQQVPRIVISTAIVLLLAAAVALTLGNKALALDFGDYAFYFLLAGVVFKLISFITSSSGDK
ncbi:hypothetical protein ACFLW1_02915 [Chloroflexota bacterium]